MAEFEPLAALKNVLLTPLAKIRPAEMDLPSHGANSSVSRHDHHNVEVKTVSEIGLHASIVETDLYLFVPRSFEIASVGKTELEKDFRTRIRLALPVSEDLSAAAFESALEALQLSLKAFEKAENAGEHLADLNSLLADELLECLKNLCAIIGETLKHGISEHCRQFLISHTLLATDHARMAGLDALGKQSALMGQIVDRARAATLTKHASAATIFAFFDEYISQLYVQYLGAIRIEYTKLGLPKDEACTDIYMEGRRRLERALDGLQEKEAQYRIKFANESAASLAEESDLERERRLVRMSQLKKFFQSNTFIDVSRRQAAKKITESTATIGTAMAALVAALIEAYSRSNITNAALNGVVVISLGVIFYTLRDRLKDWTKNRFQERALKLFPDFEQSLLAGDRKIGMAKEWFRIVPRNELPDEIHDLRKAASTSEMEARLPEDVFHCRKVQDVNSSGLETVKRNIFSQALHENTRINFERYLKHMDDPFKEIVELDQGGHFRRLRSHRVYHFYLCVKTVTKPFTKKGAAPGPRREQALLYRIVIDKRGVVRLENLST